MSRNTLILIIIFCALIAAAWMIGNDRHVNKSSHLFLIVKNGLAGYMDKAGRIIIKPQFQSAGSFCEGMAIITMNGKKGYIDMTGKIIIPPQFDSAWWFSEGFAVVGNGDWGAGKNEFIIDKTGRIVIQAEKNMFFWPTGFKGGLAEIVETNTDKVGFINKEGQIVIKPQFDGACDFSEGLWAVNTGDRNKGIWGYIDKNGYFVIEPQFDSARGFSEGLAAVKIDEKWGFIDKAGKIVINPQFDGVNISNVFSEGLAAVKIGDKLGFIDKAGQIVISPQFEQETLHSSKFSEGLCAVMLNGKYGYIDKTGQMVIKPLFSLAGEFTEGSAGVLLGSSNIFDTNNIEMGLIDKTGKYIWGPSKVK